MCIRDRFWEMHDLLFEHQDALRPQNLHDYAAQLDLDLDRFVGELRKHVRAARVACLLYTSMLGLLLKLLGPRAGSDREREAQAREEFDLTGRWPDE